MLAPSTTGATPGPTLRLMSGLEFTEEVRAAVTAHMNADHAEDSRVICAWFTQAEVDAATLLTVDAEGLSFEVQSNGRSRRVRVPWGREINERADIRRSVVALHRQATTPGNA